MGKSVRSTKSRTQSEISQMISKIAEIRAEMVKHKDSVHQRRIDSIKNQQIFDSEILINQIQLQSQLINKVAESKSRHQEEVMS
jgi:hypothetical protein